jgi:hypothetical protein
MALLFGKVGPREGAVLLLEYYAPHHRSEVEQTLLGFLEVTGQVLFLDLSEDLAVGGPLIGLALDAVGSFEVEALIVRLEDAAMPEADIGSHPRPHISLVFCSVFLLQMAFEVFVKLSRHHKQTLIFLHRLFFLF